jgi:hypothetical protein
LTAFLPKQDDGSPHPAIPAIDALPQEPIQHLQSALARAVSLKKHNMLLHELGTTDEDSDANMRRTLFLSTSSTGTATGWLHANPAFGPPQRIPGDAFISAGQVALGVPLFDSPPPNATCRKCNMQVTRYAHHALRCSRAGMRYRRHNLVRDALLRFIKRHRARLPHGAPRLEPPVEELGYERNPPAEGGPPAPQGGDRRHRADLAVYLYEGWQVIDVTVVQPDRSKGTASAPGVAARTAYDKKSKFYTDRYNIATDRVWPLAFDSYGRAAEQSSHHLQRLVAAIAGDDKAFYATLIAQLYAELSTAIVVGNHAMLVAYRGTGAPLGDANAG